MVPTGNTRHKVINRVVQKPITAVPVPENDVRIADIIRDVPTSDVSGVANDENVPSVRGSESGIVYTRHFRVQSQQNSGMPASEVSERTAEDSEWGSNEDSTSDAAGERPREDDDDKVPCGRGETITTAYPTH